MHHEIAQDVNDANYTDSCEIQALLSRQTISSLRNYRETQLLATSYLSISTGGPFNS
jgi:hypothetical protein